MAGEKCISRPGNDSTGCAKGEKESEVVGRLCNELWKDRIDPVTLMSAADDRVFRFRHPSD